VPRRVSLPHADDLFRRTGDTPVVRAVPDEVGEDRAHGDRAHGDRAHGDRAHGDRAHGDRAHGDRAPSRKPSGRVRHDEKMTVYVTSAELLELEQARLALRAAHGLAVDRGRLVREALALVLADFDAHGDESALVRRLTEE
jgi:hypothetical protein